MTITVTPTTDTPTHDVSLTDGSTTYGLRACNWKGEPDIHGFTRNPSQQHSFKTYSGATKWVDIKPPYSAVSQDDWSGGFGSGEFERNTSAYKIAHGINTMSPNKAFLGPLATFATGYTSMDRHVTQTTNYWMPAYYYHAVSFVASASYTATKVYILMKPYETPTDSFSVSIYSNNAGSPGTIVGTGGTGNPTNTNIFGEWWEFTISAALTATTTYWVVLNGGSTKTKYWMASASATTGGKVSDDGTTWGTGATNYPYDFNFVVMSATKDFKTLFAEYKGALYACLSFDDGTAPTLWVNGAHGCVTSATTTVLTVSGTTMVADQLIGGVCKLISGTGSNVRINYRTITDNDATTITVSPAFDVAAAADTVYAVTGTDIWTQVTSTGYLDATVTDMKSFNGALYFCMGTGTSMDSLTYYPNGSHVWTAGWDHEDTTNAKFNYIEQVTNTDGTKYIYGAGTNFLKKATAQDNTGAAAPTDLSWGSAIYVGDYQTKIMGLEKYGSPQTVWVLKEDKIYSIENDKPIEIPLQEMTSVKSEDNGYAHCTQGVYLYFSLLKSMERYYNNNLDDINPQRDVGIPSNQRGAITAMVSYPGKIYFSIDAGTTGYSSICIWDGVAFHEYYRGEYGKRIKSLFVQTIPGATIDRIWFSEGNKIKWLPIDLIAYDNSNYLFTPEGFLETSWIYNGPQDVYKTYKSLKLFIDCSSSAHYINAYYMKDSDSTWTAISGNFDTSPSEEINFTTPIAAKRIKLGFLFTRTSSNSQTRGSTSYYTPYLRAWVLTGTISMPVKWVYTLRYVAQDEAIDREGDDDSYTAVETIINQLDTWAAAGTPLTMRSISSYMDNKTVIIDPQSVTPIMVTPDDQVERAIAQVTLLEV